MANTPRNSYRMKNRLPVARPAGADNEHQPILQQQTNTPNAYTQGLNFNRLLPGKNSPLAWVPLLASIAMLMMAEEKDLAINLITIALSSMWSERKSVRAASYLGGFLRAYPEPVVSGFGFFVQMTGLLYASKETVDAAMQQVRNVIGP